MVKCVNNCADAADSNITWPTSRGSMTANFCGTCSASWWNNFKNTPAGQASIFSEPKSKKELADICKEYQA